MSQDSTNERSDSLDLPTDRLHSLSTQTSPVAQGQNCM